MLQQQAMGYVYGGLAQLLCDYCQAEALQPPAALLEVKQQERFAYVAWRDILLDLAAQRPQVGLGLHIAGYIQPQHLGVLAYLTQCCAHLGEAMLRYQTFYRLVYDGSPLQVDAQDDLFSIRWLEPELNPTQLTDEIAIALMVKFMQLFVLKHNVQLAAVDFRHAAPADMSPYTDFFGCPVRFSQPRTQLWIPQSLMSVPIVQADSTLQHLLLQQAQALLAKLPSCQELDYQLQRVLLHAVQTQQVSIDAVAAQLHISVRQLQRHLQQQGHSFQERLQQVRAMLAYQYLQDRHLSLLDIALLLGYSEQSALQRAFKQWTGMTPLQWRKTHFAKSITA